MQITTKGSEDIDFTGFEDFDQESGEFRDTLVYVTNRPEWARKLFIEKPGVSIHKSIIFEPVCQTQKTFTGSYFLKLSNRNLELTLKYFCLFF